MTFASIVALITGIFQFLDQVKWLVGVLRSTPEENHEALIKSIQAEVDNFKKTGRPTWS